MVTWLVNGYLAPAAHAKGKTITAAVFPGPRLARINVRRDWGRWHLDGWVGEQTREGVSAVKKPIYSGLFVPGMDEATFTRTVEIALEAGASGVSVFSDGGMDGAKWKALGRIHGRAAELKRRPG
jgi:predicted kinase